jgi:hypothetical protein
MPHHDAHGSSNTKATRKVRRKQRKQCPYPCSLDVPCIFPERVPVR